MLAQHTLGATLVHRHALLEARTLLSAAVERCVAHRDRDMEGGTRSYLAQALKLAGNFTSAEGEARLDEALRTTIASTSWTAKEMEVRGKAAQTAGALKAAQTFMEEDRRDLCQLLDAAHTLAWWIDQQDDWNDIDLDEDRLTEFFRLARNLRRMVSMSCLGLKYEPVLRDLTVREEEESDVE